MPYEYQWESLRSVPGAGLGYRRSMGTDIPGLERGQPLELTLETFLRSPDRADLVIQLRDSFQLLTHGLNLSIGSPFGINAEYLTDLRWFTRLTGTKYHSDHLAITWFPGYQVDGLIPPPLTEESLDICVANVIHVQDVLEMPIALENVSDVFGFEHYEIEPRQFLRSLVERTGCGFLLDVSNEYANSYNFDVYRGSMAAYPLENLAHLHLAGGRVMRDGFLYDTHDAAIPEGPWDALASLAALTPLPTVIIEYDANVPSPSEIRTYCARIESIINRAR